MIPSEVIFAISRNFCQKEYTRLLTKNFDLIFFLDLGEDDGFESAWTYVECSICRKIHTVPGNKYHLMS